MLKVLLVLLVAAAFVLPWYFSDIRRLARTYGCNTVFNGTLVHCAIRFTLAESGADAAVGANAEGLYVSSSMLTTPVFIPWRDLRHSESTFPNATRFEVPSLKIGLGCVTFFLPRETARQ